MLQISSKTDRKCCVCAKSCLQGSKYCPDCSRFYRRMRNKKFPPMTVQSLWAYIRKYGYVCYYTKMPLDTQDKRSPWYCVFDHWKPRDPKKVVITSAFLNDMKSDSDEKEFWYNICQLADYKRLHTKIKLKKPVYWYRLIQSGAPK